MQKAMSMTASVLNEVDILSKAAGTASYAEPDSEK